MNALISLLAFLNQTQLLELEVGALESFMYDETRFNFIEISGIGFWSIVLILEQHDERNICCFRVDVSSLRDFMDGLRMIRNAPGGSWMELGADVVLRCSPWVDEFRLECGDEPPIRLTRYAMNKFIEKIEIFSGEINEF